MESETVTSRCAPIGGAPGLAYTLAFLAFLAHSIAEIAQLPAWLTTRDLGPALVPGQFGNAVLGLTLAGALVFVVGRTLQLNRPVQPVVAATTGAILANAATHIAVNLATRSLMPGLLTALVLVLPANAWLLYRLPLTRRAKTAPALAGALAMPALAASALWLAA